MAADQERWAEALAIEKWKGDAAPAYIAGRIGALAIAGDEARLRRFPEADGRRLQIVTDSRS